MSQTENIEQLIISWNRRLQKLQNKKALEGYSVSPEMLLEIEDIEKEIEKLQEALNKSNEATLEGYSVNSDIFLEIKDIKAEIEKLRKTFNKGNDDNENESKDSPNPKNNIYKMIFIFIGVVAIIGIMGDFPTFFIREIEYVGRIVDSETSMPIKGAEVSFESQGMPLVDYTDDKGIYRFSLTVDDDKVAGQIVVRADGYEIYDLKTTLNVDNLNIGNIHLTPKGEEQPPTSTPPPAKAEQILWKQNWSQINEPIGFYCCPDGNSITDRDKLLAILQGLDFSTEKTLQISLEQLIELVENAESYEDPNRNMVYTREIETRFDELKRQIRNIAIEHGIDIN